MTHDDTPPPPVTLPLFQTYDGGAITGLSWHEVPLGRIFYEHHTRDAVGLPLLRHAIRATKGRPTASENNLDAALELC